MTRVARQIKLSLPFETALPLYVLYNTQSRRIITFIQLRALYYTHTFHGTLTCARLHSAIQLINPSGNAFRHLRTVTLSTFRTFLPYAMLFFLLSLSYSSVFGVVSARAAACACNFRQNSARSSIKPLSIAISGASWSSLFPMRKKSSGNRVAGVHTPTGTSATAAVSALSSTSVKAALAGGVGWLGWFGQRRRERLSVLVKNDVLNFAWFGI